MARALSWYAFLSEIRAAGHTGVIVTAGNSATGCIAASLTRRLGVPAIFLVRSADARERLGRHGVENVLVTSDPNFEGDLGRLAAELGATVVFDGVGGNLLSRVAPALPMNSTIYVYGFLGASVPFSLSTMLLMGKNLAIRRFTVLENAIARNPRRLADATQEIEGMIVDPLFETRIGKEFSFDEIDAAMAFEATPGARAVLVA